MARLRDCIRNEIAKGNLKHTFKLADVTNLKRVGGVCVLDGVTFPISSVRQRLANHSIGPGTRVGESVKRDQQCFYIKYDRATYSLVDKSAAVQTHSIHQPKVDNLPNNISRNNQHKIQSSMEVCKQALIEYFQKELPKLKESYNWSIPKTIKDFPEAGQSSYKANVNLKKYFNQKWHSSNFDERLKLSKTIISDWGGVRSNHQSTLTSYVLELDKKNPATPIKGIASYSKIFSVTDIDKYAIYDARVAACLNAVQWNKNVTNGVAFNYISGRNNITGHVGKKVGFTQLEKFKVKSLIAEGWKRINRDETYQTYLELLQECLEFFKEYNMYDLEMVLFANSEKECARAMFQ